MAPKKQPKIDVIARGLLIDGSRVLLCSNRAQGYAYLPGGHVEFGESAADALAREFEEETGLTARIGAPLMVMEQVFEDAKGRRRHGLLITFHVEQLLDAEGDPTTEVISREDKIAFEWVELAAIPEAPLLPPEHRAWIAAGGEVAGDPITWVSAAPHTTSRDSLDGAE